MNSARENIQIVNPVTFEGWDDLLLSRPQATIFHSSAWARVLSESYRYTPFYFAVMDGNRLSALLPVMEVKSILTGSRGVSLPFTDYCDPIVDRETGFQSLLDDVIEYGRRRGWKFLEIRGGQGVLGSVSPSSSFLGHNVELSEDEEEMFYGFKDSARRNIKKANREGVEVGVFDSLESVREFYRLNCLTRRDHGLPPQPLTFFEKVHEHIIGKDHGFIVLGSYRDRYIGGAVFFHFGRKALYKYGASDRKFQRLRANNLVMWEAIRWLCERGFKSLCLGRTEPDNEGLLQFKSGLRPTERPINYYRYDLKKGSFVSGSSKARGFHNGIFRKLPIPLLSASGNLLYRHFG